MQSSLEYVNEQKKLRAFECPRCGSGMRMISRTTLNAPFRGDKEWLVTVRCLRRGLWTFLTLDPCFYTEYSFVKKGNRW